jgi:hypothetical protein
MKRRRLEKRGRDACLCKGLIHVFTDAEGNGKPILLCNVFSTVPRGCIGSYSDVASCRPHNQYRPLPAIGEVQTFPAYFKSILGPPGWESRYPVKSYTFPLMMIQQDLSELCWATSSLLSMVGCSRLMKIQGR